MENNIIKQAKSDIFKELYPIIRFYIKKGANAKSLKKYYKNEKRFKDILEDIKNKGINLVKDEDEYNKVVRNTLNEILDDFIAKEKDEEYKNKQIKKKEKKMKHIKEFNSYKINEEFSWLLSIGAAYFLLKFIKGFIKNRRYSKMTQDEINDEKKRKSDYSKLMSLINYIRIAIKNEKDIVFSENFLYYIFSIDEVTIKIDKRNKTIFWTNFVPSSFLRYSTRPRVEFTDIGEEEYEFTEPIPITEEDINGLIEAIKKDNEDKNK
jgi:hypothetical protein